MSVFRCIPSCSFVAGRRPNPPQEGRSATEVSVAAACAACGLVSGARGQGARGPYQCVQVESTGGCPSAVTSAVFAWSQCFDEGRVRVGL